MVHCNFDGMVHHVIMSVLVTCKVLYMSMPLQRPCKSAIPIAVVLLHELRSIRCTFVSPFRSAHGAINSSGCPDHSMPPKLRLALESVSNPSRDSIAQPFVRVRMKKLTPTDERALSMQVAAALKAVNVGKMQCRSQCNVQTMAR